MIWDREFKSGPRGRLFGFLFGKLGERIFNKYAEDVLENLEKPEGSCPNSASLPRRSAPA